MIDKNRDSFINENELRNWIRSQSKQYIQKSTEARWLKINGNQDDALTFEELLDSTIGEPDTCIKLTIYNIQKKKFKTNICDLAKIGSEKDKVERKEDYQRYLKMMERDKKKFMAADQDKDQKLSKKGKIVEFLLEYSIF